MGGDTKITPSPLTNSMAIDLLVVCIERQVKLNYQEKLISSVKLKSSLVIRRGEFFFFLMLFSDDHYQNIMNIYI